ncbi:MAG TPA: MFS transporter [Candidatus Limnocylindrales bacterium]|nr:MFS transporter [Candidatus Limnocylindrales bacterium]
MPLIPALLHRPAFRNLWLGQTISVFGDQITLLAIPIIAVLVLNAEPEQMGLLTAAGLLPHLLFSLPAGVWLDRVHRRRRLMVWADIARAVMIATIAVAFMLNALSLAQMFIVTFIVGTLAVAFDISWSTVYVKVVDRPEYVPANSLLNGSRSLAYVAGPSVGGVLIQFLTAPIAVLVDAASYVLSAFFVWRVDAPEPTVEPQTDSIRRQLSTGLSFLARDPIMRPTLASVATLNFFNWAFTALFVLYVTTRLGVSAGELGLALGAGAIGGVVGALLAARIGRRIGIGRAFLIGMIVFPIALVAVPLTPPGTPVPLVIAMLVGMEFVAGFGVMVLDINASAIIPARTPDGIRSRVSGAWRFVNMGIRPIGAIVGGLLGGLIGVQETLLATSLLQLVGVLFLLGTPVLRLHDVPEAAEHP